MENSKRKKIALFQPWIKSKGGAERVILEIVKNKKYKFDIYTWIYDKENTFNEFKKYKIKVIAPKIAKKISRFYILRGLFLLISLFSKIPLEKYDLFLIYSSGLGELITLRNYKPEKTFAYINTILRAAYEEDISWNLKYRYKNPINKFFYLISVNIYRFLEKTAWKKIDMAVFLSNLSMERAKKHNLLRNKKIKILYPPIDIKKFEKLKIKKGNYFLYVSRFHPFKRQDLLIRAWTNFVKSHPNYKLVLSGSIEDKKYFEKIKNLAKETRNIEIKTNLDDKYLLNLYKNCLAGIFIPFMEDFGIVPFEILATGKPLIAVDKGGYIDLVKKTSQVVLINEKNNEKEMIKEINKGLENFLKSKIKSKKITIKEVDSKNFIKKFGEIIK